jgi:hypothetical protein
VNRLRTRAGPWFAIALVLFVIAAAVLNGAARDVVESLAVFVLIGACIRAVALAVRDDDVSSGTVRGPAGRALGIMGAESRYAQRRRRRERESSEP